MSEFSVSVLRLPDFRLLLLVRFFGMMALVAQDVIIGWQIYSLTHDTFLLGLTGLAEAVPAIACALVAGHIVDISRPHRVIALALGVMALNMLVLLAIAGGYVAAPGGSVIPWIFGGIFLSGLARSFIMPASYALLPRVVPRPDFPAASAWFSSFFQMAAITAPAITGLIYGGYGPSKAWLLPACLMSASFILLLCMEASVRGHRSQEAREPAVKSIRAGWRFIWENRTLLTVMALDMFAVLFGGAVAMLPAYADQVLHVGAHGLGWLRAAPAVGAVFMSVLLALRPMRQIRASMLLVVVAGFGFSIIGFGLSTRFFVAMAFLGLSGAFDSVSMVIRGTLMQLLTPDRMRGRVSAVNSMFIISSNEIGTFESGLAARFFGLVPSVVLGGVGTLLVVAAAASLSPRFRKTVVAADSVPE